MKYMLRCSICGANFEVNASHACDPEWNVWGSGQGPTEGQNIRAKTARSAASWWVMSNAGDGKQHSVSVAPSGDLENVSVFTLAVRVTFLGHMRVDDQGNQISESTPEDDDDL